MAAKKTFKNQRERIISHLTKKRLSVNEAMSRYGIKNLSARISELRNWYGYDITTFSSKDTKTSTVYRLN